MNDFNAALRDLRQAGLYRERRLVTSAQGPRIELNGRSVLAMCSNDYLGLASHPEVRAAAADAAERWGAGAGASPLVSGNMALHQQLEEELAAFKRMPACVLFGSGYLANVGAVGALAQPGGVVLSDRLNHASLIDGCRLAGAQTIVYEHCDLDSLAAGLRKAAGRPALIVTDAVFSMDGDSAPLVNIAALGREYGARLLVDEAHATGVVGPQGRGLVAALGLERDVDVVTGTLGKALGSYGAFACAQTSVVSYLVNRARTLIFSTALPPPSVAAAQTALRLVLTAPRVLADLRDNARCLRRELSAAGLATPPGEMPIVPIVLGEAAAALAASAAALHAGVFVQAIRPPTVPAGTARLRVTVTAGHAQDDLRVVARVLAEAARVSATAGPRRGHASAV